MITASSSAARQRETHSHLLALAQQSAHLPDWQVLRDRAALQVQAQSFPTTRQEDWRFTDLSPLLEVEFHRDDRPAAVDLDGIGEFLLPEAESRLVFVNGVYAPALSTIATLPHGAVVSTLSAWTDPDRLQPYLGQQAGSEELFTALNTAGLSEAAIVWVPPNQTIVAPIHLLFVSTSQATPLLIQPRCLVVAGRNSAVTVIEDYVAVGAAVYFTNAVAEFWVAENADVQHIRVQRENPSAFHIGKTAVSQARDSHYSISTIAYGAALSRHNLEIAQTGEQTQTTLNGLTLIDGQRVADLHSSIALSKPYGTTRQLQKCIVDDRAHAIFNGRVCVPKAAQLTDAGQLNRNLLLSPRARVDTKPQLEIIADNVKCTHGATVGQLAADEVFYLQSRGIDADSARALLVYAFAYEVLEQMPIASLRHTLSQFVTPHT